MSAYRLNRRVFLRAAVLTGATAGLAACAGGTQPAAPAEAPAATEAPAAEAPAAEAPAATEAPAPTEAPAETPTEAPATTGERVLNLNEIGFSGDPGHFDPGCSGGAVQIMVEQLLWSSLTYFNDKMEATPDAAESWTHNEDSSVWTFNLRKDLKWTDGTPITAKDFEWTVKRNCAADITCGGPIMYMMDIIKGAADYFAKKTDDPNTIGVKALDDYTLQFDLVGPAGYFPIMAQYVTYVPLPKDPIEKFGTDNKWLEPQYILSNGPFKLTEWTRDQQIVMVPNEHWYGYKDNKPGVDKIVIKMIENQATGIAAYETGELDVIEVPTGDLPRVQADAELSKQLVTYAELLTQYMQIRPGVKPFDDIRVRHALAKAIDRDAISEVLVGAVKPAYQFMAPTMLGYEEELIPEMRYDPDGARALLEEAGFPGGEGFPKFWINSNHTDDYQVMFEAISSMYKDVLGIDMELALMDAGARGAWADQEPFRPHLWRERWGMDFPDTHNSMNFMAGKLSPNEKHPEWVWVDEKFKDLVMQAGQEADPKVRHELYKQVDRICCWENPIIIPIYYAVSNLMMKPRVQNVWVTGMGPNYRNVVVEG